MPSLMQYCSRNYGHCFKCIDSKKGYEQKSTLVIFFLKKKIIHAHKSPQITKAFSQSEFRVNYNNARNFTYFSNSL